MSVVVTLGHEKFQTHISNIPFAKLPQWAGYYAVYVRFFVVGLEFVGLGIGQQMTMLIVLIARGIVFIFEFFISNQFSITIFFLSTTRLAININVE